jgi:hypothetical protein
VCGTRSVYLTLLHFTKLIIFCEEPKLRSCSLRNFIHPHHPQPTSFSWSQNQVLHPYRTRGSVRTVACVENSLMLVYVLAEAADLMEQPMVLYRGNSYPRCLTDGINCQTASTHHSIRRVNISCYDNKNENHKCL